MKKVKIILASLSCLVIPSIGGYLTIETILDNQNQLVVKNSLKADTTTSSSDSSLTAQVAFTDSNTTTTTTTIQSSFSIAFYSNDNEMATYWFTDLITFTPIGSSLLTLAISTDYTNHTTSYDKTAYSTYFEPTLDSINSQIQAFLNIYLSDSSDNRASINQYLYNQSYTISDLSISFSDGYDADSGNAKTNDVALSGTYKVTNTYQDEYNNAESNYQKDLDEKDEENASLQAKNDDLAQENADLTTQNNNLQQQNDDLTQQNSDLENENQSLKDGSQVNQLQSELNTANTIKIVLIVVLAVVVVVVIGLASYLFTLKRKLRN